MSCSNVSHLQLLVSSQFFSRVDLEIQCLDDLSNLIRGQETNIFLKVLNSVTRKPVEYRIDGEEKVETEANVCVGNMGYNKWVLSFDPDTNFDDIVVSAEVPNLKHLYYSNEISLIKYRIELRDTRLTDDIANYDGKACVHFTNNDSARVKILYTVWDEDGMLTDFSKLAAFHSRVRSGLLFANGDKIQHRNAEGRMVDISEIDCAVKRKNKEKERTRVHKRAFEERNKELRIESATGIVCVSYRVNILSSHEIMGKRMCTIELNHPNARAVSVSPFLVKSKYHRKQPSTIINGQADGVSHVKIKEENISVKTEKKEELVKEVNNSDDVKPRMSSLNASSLNSPSLIFPQPLDTLSYQSSYYPFIQPSIVTLAPANCKLVQTFTIPEKCAKATCFVNDSLQSRRGEAPLKKKAYCREKAKAFKKATFVKRECIFHKPSIFRRRNSGAPSLRTATTKALNQDIEIIQSFLSRPVDKFITSYADIFCCSDHDSTLVPEISDDDIELYLNLHSQLA